MALSDVHMEQIQNEEQVLAQTEVLAGRGQWKEAAALLQEYREKCTLSMEALSKLAYYCSRAGDYDSAIALYENLSQQQPSKARWLYALGFQYQKKEQWQEAIAAYEHSLQLAPRWLRAALSLGDAYRAAAQLEKAYEAYQKGIQHYHGLTVARRSELVSIYAKVCARTARVLLGKPMSFFRFIPPGLFRNIPPPRGRVVGECVLRHLDSDNSLFRVFGS